MAAHWKDAGIATEVLDKLLEERDPATVFESGGPCRGAEETAGGEYAERRA